MAQVKSRHQIEAGEVARYDPIGLNWGESSKFGTGIGTVAGGAAGAGVGLLGGPIGAVLGGALGALVGAGLGALGDAAGEAFVPVRDHEAADDERAAG